MLSCLRPSLCPRGLRVDKAVGWLGSPHRVKAKRALAPSLAAGVAEAKHGMQLNSEVPRGEADRGAERKRGGVREPMEGRRWLVAGGGVRLHAWAGRRGRRIGPGRLPPRVATTSGRGHLCKGLERSGFTRRDRQRRTQTAVVADRKEDDVPGALCGRITSVRPLAPRSA
jgi:hypothetical protein